MYCPDCGRTIADESKFCKFCGFKTNYATEDQAQTGATAEPPQSSQQQQGMPAPTAPPPGVGQPVVGTGKDFLTTMLLCIFLGVFGIHRFYTGHILIGILQLCTGSCCGIWALYDLIIIATGAYRDFDGNPLVKNS